MTSNSTPRAKKQTARDKGVPDAYLTERGTFKPGWDARLKSELRAAASGEPKANPTVVWKPAAARRMLDQLGWPPSETRSTP